MSHKDLKDKYGKNGGTKAAVNRAIRGEIVGGDDVLDALELVHRAHHRVRERGLAGADELAEALDALNSAADLWRVIILRRYQIDVRDDQGE